MAFNGIATEWAAYQAGLAAHAPGYFQDLNGIADALAALLDGDATLKAEGLVKAFSLWSPIAPETDVPWIVCIPIKGTGRTFDVGAYNMEGQRGGNTENLIQTDIFIAGGTYAEDYHICMARAFKLWLPMQFLLSKNTSLDGAGHLVDLGDAVPHEYPVLTKVFRGLAVSASAQAYYNLPSG